MASTSGVPPFDRGLADLAALAGRVFLAADLGEIGRQVIVLALRPALERMVVALIAVETHAQEQLGRVFHRLFRRAEDLVVGRRRIFERRAAGRQDRVHELVVGHVARHGLLDPAAQGKRPLLAQELAIHLQQVGPLVGPQLDVVAAADQPIDQLVALDLRVARVGDETRGPASAVGGRPVRSSETRRMNSASVHSSLGSDLTRFSLL